MFFYTLSSLEPLFFSVLL